MHKVSLQFALLQSALLCCIQTVAEVEEWDREIDEKDAKVAIYVRTTSMLII